MASVNDAVVGSKRRHITDLNLNNIPHALTQAPQWVCFRLGPRKKDGKRDKTPINPHTGGRAAVNNPATWGTLEEVTAAYLRGLGDGLGFVFTASDPYFGLDLDSCRDPQTSTLEPWAAAEVERLDTYAEASISGTGVHVIGKGALPGGGGKHGQLEVYDHGRFFTMSGEHLGGCPTEIEERQDALTALYQKHFPHKMNGKPNGVHADATATTTTTTSEKEYQTILAELQQALPFIPADDYALWIDTGMGIHSVDSGETGFTLWLEWSRRSEHFHDEADCQKHWRSFHSDGGRTHKSIFALARAHGWRSHGNSPDEDESDEEENTRILREERPVEDPHEEETDGDLVLVCGTDIEPEDVEWLWYPYLPRRKLCLLGGDPGLGKTYVAISIAASFSVGRWPFPIDGQPQTCPVTRTIFCISEDGVEDTILPRFIGCGGDRSQIHFLNGRKDKKGTVQRIDLADEERLVKAMRRRQASLLVFDPLQRFLPPKTKMNEMETISPVVETLKRVAARTDSTVLLLGHLNKSKHDTLAYKFIGSVEWYAAARSVMLVVRDKDKPLTDRLFYQTKNSVGPEAGGVSFSIDRERPQAPFLWGSPTTMSAQEAMNGASDGKKTRAVAAVAFLERELQNGEVSSEDLFTKAKDMGISRNAVFEAKKELGIVAGKRGFASQWFWSLPVEETE